ncbi:MAG: Holliday junction branch migration protein RuvA [Breznakibacter sp.]
MLEYIKGKLVESSPAHVVVEANGIGYFLNISLNTFTHVGNKTEVTMYVHENLREDAHTLYGFVDKAERELFRHLVSVSGVGANTARMMLSGMSPAELNTAIVTGNLNVLKAVKGIGLKTAQRILVELKDKLGKEPQGTNFLPGLDNTVREEALSALVMLGFVKANCQKAIDKIMAENPGLTVENIIKQALKML